MPAPFSFIPTLAGPPADNRAFYDYPALGMPPNMAALNGNPNSNAHRQHDSAAAAAYAITNQFGRDQLIQRSTMPFVRDYIS